MKKSIQAQRFSWIVLAIILFSAASCYFITRSYLLLSSDAAGALSFFLFLIFSFLLTKRKKLEQYIIHLIANRRKPRIVIPEAISLISLLSLIFYAFIAIILRMPVLWADEWHNFHRILFADNLSEIIFSRYNHHPSYLINALYAINIKYLGSNILWFTIINVVSIFGIGTLYFSIIRKNKSIQFSKPERIMIASIAALFSFWIMGANNVFWNMAYFQVFGAILSIYGLSIQNKEGIKKGGLLFLLGAMMISTSFGNGAAVWPLGFAASVLLGQNLLYKLGYLVIGIIGSGLTMGIFSYSKGIVKAIDALTVIQAIPTYIGGGPIILINGYIPSGTHTSIALVLGTLGLFLSTYLIVNFIKSENRENENIGLFGSLLCLFAIGCSLLVIFGRLTSDLSLMTTGRYTCWSSLFWVGLFFLIVRWVSNIKKHRIKSNTVIVVAILSLIYLTLHNMVMIQLRLFTYNAAIRSKVDLLVSPDKMGNEKITWHPNRKLPHLRQKVLEVNTALKEKGQNIYKLKGSQKTGKQIKNQEIISGISYNADVTIFNDTIGNYYLEGYIKKGSQKEYGKPNLIVISQDRTIVGLGLPYSDFQRNRLEKQSGLEVHNQSLSLFGHFPGVSKYYFAQFNPLESSTSEDVELFAFTDEEKYIKINVL